MPVSALGNTSRLTDRLRLLAAEHADLLRHARAAVAAVERGEDDPIGYVRDVLAAHGQLPPTGANPSQLLAVCSQRDLGVPA